MAELGLVESVDTINDGDFLTADLTAGATVLPVDNTDIFETDTNTGSVQINAVTYDYSSVDSDGSTITLTSGLLADADMNDSVYVWPLTPVKIALVTIDEGIGDSIPARVPSGLAVFTALDDGPREPDLQETVALEEDDHGWVVSEIIGQSPTVATSNFEPAHRLRQGKAASQNTRSDGDPVTVVFDRDTTPIGILRNDDRDTFTVTKTGLYLINAQVGWQNNTEHATMMMAVMRDAATLRRDWVYKTTDDNTVVCHVSVSVYLSAGMEISVTAAQNSGSTLALEASSLTGIDIVLLDAAPSDDSDDDVDV